MPQTNLDQMSNPGPRATTALALSLPFLVLIAVLALVGILGSSSTATDPQLDPEPVPSPSPTTWSEECTAEDLDDGACLTWDDIRDLEWHSEP